jgi:glycosyltransferase involved in cell wall biosynthesis
MTGLFDLPFDQYQRYSLAASLIEELRKPGRPLRLLEVGAHEHRNLERFLPGDHVTYLDREGRPREGGKASFVAGDATTMPFPDGSFDVVVSLDVFEHVPPQLRDRFLSECARLCRVGVLLAAPFEGTEVEAAELQADGFFAGMFGASFRWLEEHRIAGLPRLEHTVEQFRRLGLATHSFGHGNLTIWNAAMHLHFLKEGVPLLAPAVRAFDAVYNRLIARRDHEPPFYRHFVVALAAEPAKEALGDLGKGTSSDPDLPTIVDSLTRPALLSGRRLLDAERSLAAAGQKEAAIRAELAAAAAALGEGRDRERALSGGLAASQARELALGQELEAMQRQQTSLAAQLSSDHEDARALHARVAAAEQELDARGLRLARLHVELKAVQEYPPWRLGRPLRRILGRIPSFLLPSALRPDFGLQRDAALLRGSGSFDTDHYRLQNPDVAEAGLDPVLHYLRFGAAEGRDPSPSFNTDYYLRANPDVAENGINPLLHFLRYGEHEGRPTRPPSEPPGSYADWVRRYDTLRPEDRAAIRAHLGSLPQRPLISVVMPVYNPPEPLLRRAIESVRAQIYEDWELCIADDASTQGDVRRVLEAYGRLDPRIKVRFRETNGHISAASNSALELAQGEFIALLDQDDEISPHALYLVATAVLENPRLDVCYSDEDKLDDQGRRYDPHFKSDWNEGLFYSYNFISHLGVYRTALVRDVGGFREGYEGSQDYDLALRCIERTSPDRIVHLPFVLYHWRAVPGSAASSREEKVYAHAAARRALNDHFRRRGHRGEVVDGAAPGLNRARFEPPRPWPLVSIIVPTRDNYPLLRACLKSVIGKTTYPNYEIVVVDNQSSDPDALAYFQELAADPRVQVLRYDAPFNYSAINNFAARACRGSILCLLNNDIEVIAPDWLDEMVGHAARPETGAVGAKLLYADGSVQHAGVILGVGGVAGHAFKRRAATEHGYFSRAVVGQEVSAVTGACLVVRREVFEEVGGLNQDQLKVAFNDVDFCLRVARAGYRNYWTPYALLRHHESKSRGYEDTPERVARFQAEIAYMRSTWLPFLEADPAYSPNLTVASEDFGFAHPPRVRRPWAGYSTVPAVPGAKPRPS